MDAVFIGLIGGLAALTLGLIAVCHALQGAEK